MKQMIVRLAAVAAMLAAFATFVAPSAGAQATTSLTVHHRLCGDNYNGGSEWDECHDVLVGTAFDFTIDGPVTQTAATNVATGNVTFAAIPAGTYHLFGGIPGEFSNQTVYCSDENTGNAVTVGAGEIGVTVEVPEGASVVCDVYEFPEDLRGDPTPTPVPPVKTPTPDSGQGVSRLPNTGAGGNDVSFPIGWMVIPALVALALGFMARKHIVRQNVR